MKILKDYPLPISGLFLSMLTLGNILQTYSNSIRVMIGIAIFLLYIIYIQKLIFCFSDVMNAVNTNPLVASSFPVIAMASVVLSSYIKPFSSEIANFLWYGALVFYTFYIPYFTYRYIKGFKITNVFATWYIVYVGIAIIGIFSRVSGNYTVGQFTFWFGLVTFLILLPIICYRVLKYPNITDLQRPSLIVLAAPASLLFLSYYFSVAEKNSAMLIFLFVLSILFYVIALFLLPRILKQDFYPTLSATTFPMVTGAFVSRLMAEYFVSYQSIFSGLYLVQLVIAVFVVTFAFVSYMKFFIKYFK